MLKHNVDYLGMLVLTFVKVRVRLCITLVCIASFQPISRLYCDGSPSWIFHIFNGDRNIGAFIW